MEIQMADEATGPKRLTVEDPITQEQLDQLDQLQTAWTGLAEENARLDQKKIQLLAALKRIGDEQTRLFEILQVERGLSPRAKISIDPKSRKIEVLDAGT
jgi:hypothetical protein